MKTKTKTATGLNRNAREHRTPARLTTRPAGQCDLVPLSFFFDTALRKDYFLRRGQLADMLKNKHHNIFVAEIDCVLVGVAITSAGSRLINALVHPAYRGLGIGRALVEQSGATEVRAKLDMSSGDPRGFYQSMGFSATGKTNTKGNIELMKLTGNGRANANGNGHSRTPAKPPRTSKPTRRKRGA